MNSIKSIGNVKVVNSNQALISERTTEMLEDTTPLALLGETPRPQWLSNIASSLGWQTIYIDRSSVLGNPWQMKEENERSLVIAGYRLYLWHILELERTQQWQELNQRFNLMSLSSKFSKEINSKCGLKIAIKMPAKTPMEVISKLHYLEALLRQGKSLRLVCHCAPLPCHGDVLVRYFTWKLSHEI